MSHTADLFGFVQPESPSPTRQPEADTLQRDWYGYRQYRDSTKDPWHFIVTGFDDTFTGQEGFCSVLLTDGERDRVPIDAQDRILIRGRRYGRDQWVH